MVNVVVLIVIIGGLFGVFYFGNLEMENGVFWVGIGYVIIGVIWIFIMIKMGSLELFLGGYAVNNMFLFIFFIEDYLVYGVILLIFLLVGGYEIYDCILSLVINMIFVWFVFCFVKKEKQQAA